MFFWEYLGGGLVYEKELMLWILSFGRRGRLRVEPLGAVCSKGSHGEYRSSVDPEPGALSRGLHHGSALRTVQTLNVHRGTRRVQKAILCDKAGTDTKA